jgi:hypothetical protein
MRCVTIFLAINIVIIAALVGWVQFVHPHQDLHCKSSHSVWRQEHNIVMPKLDITSETDTERILTAKSGALRFEAHDYNWKSNKLVILIHGFPGWFKVSFS